MNHDAIEATDRHPRSRRRLSFRRAAAVALAIGGLSAVALAPAGAASSPTTATKISTAKVAKLGAVLVAGNTVYTLKPSKTACTAACLKVWIAVSLPSGVTKPTAGTGVDASKLGTKAEADGTLQVTYGGKPLYWFVKDTAPGQARGSKVSSPWGKWAVVTTKASSGSGGTNAGTGGVSF